MQLLEAGLRAFGCSADTPPWRAWPPRHAWPSRQDAKHAQACARRRCLRRAIGWMFQPWYIGASALTLRERWGAAGEHPVAHVALRDAPRCRAHRRVDALRGRL